MEKFKFTTTFSSIVKPVVSAEKDALLSLASIDTLKQFLPNVDAARNADLLPIAFNACVINRFNLNDDGMDAKTAVAVADLFINKQINIEHNRQRVCGVILSAGFSEFGTDKPLTREECASKTDAFNITLGGVIWRVVNEDLADLVEECSDPTSQNYLKVSASWELGFTEYDLALIEGESKNLANATIISDPMEIAKLENKLRMRGGNGKIGEKRIYRLVKGSVLPLGIGLTETPAADVRGITTPENEIEEEDMDEEMMDSVKNAKDINSLMNSIEQKCAEKGMEQCDIESMKEKVMTMCRETRSDLLANDKILTIVTMINDYIESELGKRKTTLALVQDNLLDSKSLENSSQLQKVIVNTDSRNMKLSSIKDLNDDVLKTISASVVTDLLQEEIRKASEAYVEQKNKADAELKATNEKFEKLVSEQKEKEAKAEADKVALETELSKLRAEVEKFNTEAEARKQEETFTARMSALDETFDLSEEDRNVLGPQIKTLSDEQFASFQKNLTVLLRDKSKKQAKASSEVVVDKALENKKSINTNVPNTVSEEKNLLKKYAPHFSEASFLIESRKR